MWDALCPLDAILCLGCFGKRLNPSNPPLDQDVGAEIRRQRKRFKLKNVNRWLGEKSNGEKYRGHYLVVLHWEPKAAETAAGLDEEMLKKVMTSKRVHERNAAARRRSGGAGRWTYLGEQGDQPLSAINKVPKMTAPVFEAMRF